MKIILRKFDAEDTAALVALFHDTVHTINAKDYPPEQLEAWAPAVADLKRWRSRFKSSKTIVAELDGKIVGFGSLQNDQSTISLLYVHKDHQGQGIATALLKKLEKYPIKQGANAVTAEVSITARPFFEKSGYGLVRESRKMLNGKEFINFIMEKALTLEHASEKKGKAEMKDKVKNKKSFRWGDLFTNKFFDLIIVILGVSIAFQLNSIKLESDQDALEHFYFESLLVDLDDDINDIDRVVKDLTLHRQMAQSFLKKLENHDVEPDSAGIVMLGLMNLESFSGNQSTYHTLVSGNGLSNLKDRDIRRQIADYYGQYFYVNRFETIHTELIYRFLFFISPSIDLAAAQITDPSIIRNVQTKNFVVIFVTSMGDGIEDYKETLEKAKALRSVIQAEIE